jgi:2,3-bisphosphoglycerate-independent phosphoglycerate mutase
MPAQRAMLIVLDGFGIGKDSPFNAIKNARMPFYRGLVEKYPHSQLLTHGAAVGLPDGVMGNSEVGHMTMGAGRIVYQDLTRISKAIRDGDFQKNPEILAALKAGAAKTGRVHLMGLLSDGGVHSHIEHLLALLDRCIAQSVPEISVHPFLDGRDTPPDSAPGFLSALLRHPAFSRPAGKSRATVATVMGRYFAMDRDKRWDRVEKAYRTLTGQIPAAKLAPIAAVEKSYASGKTDEFVEPVLLDAGASMKDGDSVIFFNYRADRAREITRAITEPEFSDFDRGPGFRPSAYVGMAQYDRTLTHMKFAFGPQNLDNIFGSWLEQRSLKQFRIAETEKYAHVTFFFNGGREEPFKGEERTLVPSPREVATYDLKPEMSAFQVADLAATRASETKDQFVLMNFANADMIGHTGNYEAAVRAMEALDQCLSKVVGAAEKSGFHVLITADHGNCEEMRDEQGRPHTQHTLNPVPAIWVEPGSAIAPRSSRKPLRDGGLSDIMPTLCTLMGLPLPKEVTGKSLC